MNAKKGFTLIELLVVIAIIALLLAIVMPSLKIARERAMEILCENNIRQFGIGTNLYCNDYNGTFPNAEDWFFLNLVRGQWTEPPDFDCVWHNALLIPNGLITHYLSSDEVRICPAFKRIAVRSSNCAKGLSTHDPTVPIEPQFNYSQNVFLGPLDYLSDRNNVLKITQVKSPSAVFVYAEENPYTIPFPNDRPIYSTHTRAASSGTPINDCLLYVLAPQSADAEIASAGSKYAVEPSFIDCLGSFHRARDADGLLGYSKAVFTDGHIQNVQPEESLIYAWPH